MEAVKKKKAKKKVWITLGIIVLILAVIFVGCSAMMRKAQAELAANMQAAQTDIVTIRPLTKSIGATGKIISLESRDITTTLSGVEIAAIEVEVGDTVARGDTLVRFDTEDIADNLSDARRALWQAEQRNALTAADAQRGVDDTLRNTDYQAQTAYDNMVSAYNTYMNTWDDLDELYEAVDEAENARYEAEKAYDSARRELQELKDALKTAAPEEIDALTAGVEAAEAAKTQAKAQAEQAEAGVKQAENAAEAMEENLDRLYDSYVAAANAYDNTVASGKSAVESAKSSQASAAIAADTNPQLNQVTLYEEQMEKGCITAPFAGVITAVNYIAGDTFLQGPILTLQDCSGYEISAQIGEYDISDIALGQEVLIKTDATREQELAGTVIFISPTATPGQGDPTYEIKISVDTPSDRLRLDMSANLSIIISQVENAMTVPYSAVQTAEDGSRFVQVLRDDQSVTEVPVEVLLESNYYTQVEGALSEGDKVILVSGENNDFFSVMTNMGAMHGGGF